MNASLERLSPRSRPVLKRLVLILAAAAAALGAVVAVLYVQDRWHEQALREQQVRHRLDLASEFLSRENAIVRSDLLYLADQQLLLEFLSDADGARSQLDQEYLSFSRRKGVYDQIRCLDTSGKELIRVNYRNGDPQVVPPADLQVKSDRYYFQEALSLKRGQVAVSEFDLNVEHGEIERPLKPVIRFLTPVFDAEGNNRGLLVLNYLGGRLLGRLDDVSLPGFTMLLNAGGDYLRGPRDEDNWGWLLAHDHSFRLRYPTVWQSTRRAPADELMTSDGLFAYRSVSLSSNPSTQDVALADDRTGVETTAKAGPASLVLVSHIPSGELYVHSSKVLLQLSAMFAGAMLVAAVLAWYWAQSAAVRTMQAEHIAESEQRLRKLSTQLLEAQESERRIISRELHDELGQQATAISLDLQLAARQQDPERTRSLLSRAIEEVEHLLKSVHQVATRVRPAVLDDLGLEDALESFVTDFSRRTGIAVDARFDFQAEEVPLPVGQHVYRIVQEALTNIAKHAEAKHVSLGIEADGHALHLSVEDGGRGFDPAQRDASRLGILGMQERAELLDGQFELQTAPGQGTRIDVRIPLTDGKA